MKAQHSQEAIIYFSDPIRCREYMVARRWPDGVHARAADERMCCSLRSTTAGIAAPSMMPPKFTLKAGTVMEDSPIGLESGFPPCGCWPTARMASSSYELHRALGVTQKTAWFMLHRIRTSHGRSSLLKIGGDWRPVEVDETFVGGQERAICTHQDGRKACYKALKARSSQELLSWGCLTGSRQVRAKVIPERKARNLAN